MKTTAVRLTKSEQEMLRRKSIEINKKLIEKGMQPLRDSQIVHKILDIGLKEIEVSEKGEIRLRIV